MIFKAESGVIKINIIKRSFPDSDDYWDANWLEAEVEIDIPNFHASYNMNFRVDELQKFNEELINLRSLFVKEASFTTMEEGLRLECKTNSRGHVLCRVKAIDEYQTCLNFDLETDIPSIAYWIKEVETVLQKYILIGSRP